MSQAWPRVTRRNRCAICNHDSWCGVSEDERHAICMRIESDHPTRNGGWLHNLSGSKELRLVRDTSEGGYGPTCCGLKNRHEEHAPPQNLNCDDLLDRWRQQQNGQIEPFAATLGVSQDALRLLGCVWASGHRAFAFPMRDANRRVIGIRLRNDLGRKWAVKGSRQGLFLNLTHVGGASSPAEKPPLSYPYKITSKLAGVGQNNLPAVPMLTEPIPLAKGKTPGEARESMTRRDHRGKTDSRGGGQTLLIVEGPTDAAAAIDLGYAVVGRPACLGCESMISEYVRKCVVRTVVIVADADLPGQRGAAKLQEKFQRAKIVTLPAKDLRSFVNSGGTRTIFEQICSAAL